MDMNFILASIGVFLVTILVLVIILLVAKKFLVPSGKVKLTVNGENTLEVKKNGLLRFRPWIDAYECPFQNRRRQAGPDRYIHRC